MSARPAEPRRAVAGRDAAVNRNTPDGAAEAEAAATGPAARTEHRSITKTAAKRPRATATREEPRVEIGVLDGYAGFHLRRAQEASLRAFVAASHQPAAFKPGRFATLMVIRLNPGLSQIDVCRAIGRDKSTISPLIRELELEGLIQRKSSAHDRRSVTLRLSPDGEAALDQLALHMRDHEQRLDAIMGERKDDLIALLKRIAADLG